jgi:hypothetical protein
MAALLKVKVEFEGGDISKPILTFIKNKKAGKRTKNAMEPFVQIIEVETIMVDIGSARSFIPGRIYDYDDNCCLGGISN